MDIPAERLDMNAVYRVACTQEHEVWTVEMHFTCAIASLLKCKQKSVHKPINFCL